MTAVEWLVNEINKKLDYVKIGEFEESKIILQQALELEKQQMLEFGSKITDRWGLTRVEPQYIEDEYNKQYKSE